MSNEQTILEKYWDIIKEEVNVKDITLLKDTISVEKSYIPLWSKLSQQFWKDTWAIIAAAKAWNYQEWEDGILIVTQWTQSWTLTANQYEIRYAWIDPTHQTINDGIIISLDTMITPALKQEWLAREISRFLNQLRKVADYTVDQKIDCYYMTNDQELTECMEQFTTFLQQEALLRSCVKTQELREWDAQDTLTVPEWSITFTVKQ